MSSNEKRVPRLREYYEKEVKSSLQADFKLKNSMEVPRLEKIVVNIGLGEAIQNPKSIEAACADLAQLTGQKAVVTKAKKSIATFKLREGMPIGAMVTLRRSNMWNFLDRLVNLALPRVRDFRGSSPKLDGNGNYSMGIKEQIIFHEINYDKVDKLRGMNITFVTNTNNDEQGKALLARLGMPFKK